MFESRFGLSGPPFKLTPDPGLFFNSERHGAVLESVHAGLREARGPIVVCGAIGTGKTTLIAKVLDVLGPRDIAIARIVSSALDTNELAHAMLLGWGLSPSAADDDALPAQLDCGLADLAASGRRALVFVDEGQRLEAAALCWLLLLNQSPSRPPRHLQVLVAGQPELHDRLQGAEFAAARAQVARWCFLPALRPADTAAYVEHRLRAVGWAGRPHFTSDAYQEIHAWTGGIPRRVNQLCNGVLLAACADESALITSESVCDVATQRTPRWLGQRAPPRDRAAPIAAAPIPCPIRFHYGPTSTALDAGPGTRAPSAGRTMRRPANAVIALAGVLALLVPAGDDPLRSPPEEARTVPMPQVVRVAAPSADTASASGPSSSPPPPCAAAVEALGLCGPETRPPR